MSKKEYKWSQMSPKRVRNLADLIVAYELKFDRRYVTKNYLYDDEESLLFINGGGIKLNEIDLGRMESKNVKGLYFCGQILDGDGANDIFTFKRNFVFAYIAGQSATDVAIFRGTLESLKVMADEV